MKHTAKYIALVVLGVILLVGGYLYGKPQNKKIIIMSNSGFQPSTVFVTKGTRVVFQNESFQSRWPASDFHPTHGIYPEFDPQEEIAHGASWGFTFDKLGRWKFHDHLIPEFKGSIVVEEKE